MFRLFCAIALLSVPQLAPADGAAPGLTEARAVFLQGVDGDKRAVRDAVNRFRVLSLGAPDDPALLAYFGASITLQGRDAPNSLDKQRLTEEGLAKIDRALDLVAADRDRHPLRDLDGMLVAADTFIHIPSFFNRYERGKRLLQTILTHRDFPRAAPGFKAAAYLAAALVAQGAGDGDAYRRYLDRAADADPAGHDGLLAAKLRRAR